MLGFRRENMLARFITFASLTNLCSFVCCVRVCPTFEEYDYSFSKNCYDDPVVDRNVTEIIQSWGFSAEEHYLTTQDGYKILLERAYHENTRGTPVIIVHGIAMNSLGFVNRGNVSLAYLLGKLGYDVWLLNYRGTWYSKRHVSLSARDPNFWSFSIHEMGIYDIRSALEHIHGKTKKKAIYVGYSMGTTGFYIYSTTFPSESRSYVKGMIGLAPVINYKEVRSLLRVMTGLLWSIAKSFVYQFWNGEVLPGYSVFMWPLIKTSRRMYLIQTVINLLFGDDFEQMDPLRYPQFATQLVDTIGAEVYTHYVQIYHSGVFQNYDHGREKNLEIYGKEYPPAYDLSKVQVPVALFVGKNDWLATETNARQLYSELPKTCRCGFHEVSFPKWNHLDFLIAKDIEKYLYRYVFRKISEMDSGKCLP